MEFISAEHSAQGVIAITVHPGNIITDIIGGEAGFHAMPDQFKVPFKETVGLPADTIVWLTAKPREWLGGRYVNCTWDMSELEGKKEKIVQGDKLRVKLDVDF